MLLQVYTKKHHMSFGVCVNPWYASWMDRCSPQPYLSPVAAQVGTVEDCRFPKWRGLGGSLNWQEDLAISPVLGPISYSKPALALAFCLSLDTCVAVQDWFAWWPEIWSDAPVLHHSRFKVKAMQPQGVIGRLGSPSGVTFDCLISWINNWRKTVL